MPSNKEDVAGYQGFVFIDANQYSNVAISAHDNSVYQFGMSTATRNTEEALEDECASDDNILDEAGGIEHEQ